MKKLTVFYLASFVLILCSCSKEAQTPDIAGTDYKLSIVKEFLPSVLADSEKVIYEGKSGNLLDFHIVKYNVPRDKRVDDGYYSTEEISYYLENVSKTYHLLVSASSNYSDGHNSIREFLYASISGTPVQDVLFPSITLTQDKEVKWGKLESNLELNGKMFQDVYVSDYTGSELNAFPFKHIYFTIDEGIIGFYDNQSTLWTLLEYN